MGLNARGPDLPMVRDHPLGRIGLPAPQLITPLATRAFAATHGLDVAEARAIAPIAAFACPVLRMHGAACREGVTRDRQSDGDHVQTRQRDPAGFAAAVNGFIAEVAAAR